MVLARAAAPKQSHGCKEESPRFPRKDNEENRKTPHTDPCGFHLGIGIVLTTPGVTSEGNGTAAVYTDERADPRQRDALSVIASGQAGGPPVLIFGRLIAQTNLLF